MLTTWDRSEKVTTTEATTWSTLPSEVIRLVLQNCSFYELGTVGQVERRARQTARDLICSEEWLCIPSNRQAAQAALWRGKCARFVVAELAGHGGAVRSISACLGRVATGSDDRRCTLLPSALTVRRSTCVLHRREVTCVALCSDSTRLATGGSDGVVRVFGVGEGVGQGRVIASQCQHELMVDRSFEPVTSIVRSLAWADASLYCGMMGGGPYRWHLPTSVVESPPASAEVARSPHEAATVALAVDGPLVVSGAHDCTVRLWTTPTAPLDCRAILHGHRGAVSSVCASNAHSLVVSGSFDRTIRLWDVRSGCCTASLPSGGRVRSLALCGAVLASSSEDETHISVWDVTVVGDGADGRRAQLMATLDGEHQGTITALAVDGDGGRIVSGDIWGMTRIWLPCAERAERWACKEYGRPRAVGGEV